MSPTHQRVLNFFPFCLLITLFIQHLFVSGALSGTRFTILNKCDHTVWPGILSISTSTNLNTTGFSLLKGESRTINAPTSWGGSIWGRTHCDNSYGTFTCATGDCGSGNLECSGANPLPPVTVAEFRLAGVSRSDIYDVSLVDGYNLPMLVVPVGVTNCTNPSCVLDLDSQCPWILKTPYGCRSACAKFGGDEYCCTGAYGTPKTCKPSPYSRLLKKACPQAYTYPFDDYNQTYTCVSADYHITFCLEFNTSQTPAERPTQWDAGMVYEGAFDNTSGSSSSTCTQLIRSFVIVGVTIVVSILVNTSLKFNKN